MTKSVKEMIRSHLIAIANLEKLDEEEDIIEMSYLDSLGFITFGMWLEEIFAITVNDEDLSEENFVNLNKIAAFVERKMDRSGYVS